METEVELKFGGLGVAEGVALGSTLWVQSDDQITPDYAIAQADVEREVHRLNVALEQTKHQLDTIQARVAEAMGGESARIFEAHFSVVDDPVFVDEVCALIRSQKRNAEKALVIIGKRCATLLSQLNDAYLRERAVDVRDVSRRVVRNLTGGGSDLLSGLKEPRVILAHDVVPSELAIVDRSKVLALVTEIGSQISHTAIMCRAMGLPAVMGVKGLQGQVPDGSDAIVDGRRGILFVSPSPKRRQVYEHMGREWAETKRRLEVLRHEPARTVDGYDVELSANIEMVADTDRVDECGAQGVGLYRSEYLYLSRSTVPDEEEQYMVYSKVADHLNPAPLIIRTLDLGGDKMPVTLKFPEEKNPFLGFRALRFCLGHPEIFKTQLRAILRASAHNPNLKLMYPMVGRAQDVVDANAILDQCKTELEEEGRPFNKSIQVGVMIEIPSAALAAEWIAPLVDFVSIGTNDLVQHTLAVDRMNERVAHLYDPTHPAILKLIRHTAEAGRKHGIWTGVCGEMAGDPRMVPLLLGMGITELSVSPPGLPLLKAVIRHITLQESKDLVEKAMELSCSEDILDLCRDVLRHRIEGVLELIE